MTTELAATPENRLLLEPKRLQIGAEITAGTFDPLMHFRNVRWPFGMGPRQPESGGTLADRLEAWIKAEDQPGARKSRIRDYRSHLRNYFRKHRIGTLDPTTLLGGEVAEFKRWLVTRKPPGAGLSQKSAANVIRGTLRAFLIGIKAPLAPLESLKWERYAPTRRQRPFEPSEVAAILAWFRTRHPIETLSLLLRLRGLRPSEVRGLEVGAFARRTGTLSISQSKHLGQVNATKTPAAERVVPLDEETARAVQAVVGIRKTEETLLEIAEDTLRDHFRACLTSLGFEQRSLYQLKHTCAINRILAGDNPGEIARDMGIDLSTFSRHYAWAIRILADSRARGGKLDVAIGRPA